MNKKIIIAIIAMLILAICASCRSSEKISYNISRAADEFNIYRKITVMNNQTDKVILEFEGWASITVDKDDNQLEITYRVGKDKYFKDYIGLNDRTTYAITQMDGSQVDKYNFVWMYHSESGLVPITIKDADESQDGDVKK